MEAEVLFDCKITAHFVRYAWRRLCLYLRPRGAEDTGILLRDCSSPRREEGERSFRVVWFENEFVGVKLTAAPRGFLS